MSSPATDPVPVAVTWSRRLVVATVVLSCGPLVGLPAIPATIAKYLGTYLTRQQIGELENIIRSESPLGQAAAAAAAKTPRGAVSKGLEAAVPPLVPALSAATASPLAAGQQ